MLETQLAEISSDQWDQRIGFLDNIYFVLYMGEPQKSQELLKGLVTHTGPG